MEKNFMPHHFSTKSGERGLPSTISRTISGVKNGAGFTLIEIVLAIFIMSWGIIAIMQVFPTTLLVSKDTEEMTRATFLAERKMEEVKSKILGRSTDPGYPYGWNYDYNETGESFPPPDENYKYTVADTEDEHPGEVKEIEVTVWHDSNNNNSWDEGENRIILDTKIAKRS